MRLHSLSLTAFGSFGGTETIDFDQLADAGLFLLHGPTGAGKTTVLDAVSFALFGTVAGVRPAGLGLRSHHALAATPTEVRLEVTLDGRRFRIVRRPRQVRPKRRGDGTVEDAPTATVQELVKGAWAARAARPVEADPYLQELLHMGVAQFHQIVMLPQGDFARFLRANADDRRLVLEDLFATHRFTEVERWLRARAETDEAAVGTADTAVRDALLAAATVAEAEPYSRDEPVAGARAWLADVRAAAGDRT
ncbi:MAG TPA: SMC family ATPase, partial [Acidimicrobiales bacterium]